MKYWFYSEGNILGPYAPDELLTLPAFAQDSLVCRENSTGDNPVDWQAASQVGEIAEVMSVGTGKIISSGYGGGDLYALENAFSQASQPAYESAPDQDYSYENLLNTIDGILKTGAGVTDSAPEQEKSFDYGLMDKFDIRLSKIQEELEAARWEKNLLLEKMRMKELEDKAQRERIAELESRLKAALGQEGAKDKELEAARWEKNLLFEKMDIKEREDRKQRERISEQLRHLADLKEKNENVKKTESAKQEGFYKAPSSFSSEELVRNALNGQPAAEPENIIKEKDGKILKNLTASGEIKLERHDGSDMAAQEGTGITSGKLKSLGGSAKSLADFGPGYGEPAQNPPASEPERVVKPIGEPPPQAAPEQPLPEKPEPLPQQAGGVVYDFTVVTAKSVEPTEKVQFKIETQFPDNAGSPAVRQWQQEASPAPAVSPGGGQPQPAYQVPGVSAGNSQQPSQLAQAGEADRPGSRPQFQSTWQATESRAGKRAPESGPKSAADSAGGPATSQGQPAAASGAGSDKPPTPVSDMEKTERITISPVKTQPETKTAAKPARKGGKMAFLIILIVFGAIAAGGLGFFFLGDGLSFSEFSMLDFNSSKRSKKGIMPSQLEPQAKDKNAAQTAPEDAAKKAQEAAAGGSQNPAVPQTPEKAAAPLAANESVKNAIVIVKNYKLSGGRGAISGWFANSFLSGSSSGASEEWSATPLHGDILVVQYRLIRQKHDPLIYQFEVDAVKNDIIRGINNNAIELLDFSQENKAQKEVAGKAGQAGGGVTAPEAGAADKKISVKKLSAKAKPARKTRKPGEIAILPLPDAPRAVTKNEDPTGFEDAQGEGGEKVKYIKAQESDEELF
ncbi:MAG: hypothetical protein NTX59_13845 [Elusimicrobia bacterium]|nr:hypothetical protein [Elusimicrobiota bacterium]